MVLNLQKDASHNAMLGRRIEHPASTNFHNDVILPAAKRLKVFESADGEDSRDVSGDEIVCKTPNHYRDEVPDSDNETSLDEDLSPTISMLTELESAMPPVKSDKEAIADYEAMRAAETDVAEDLKFRLNERSWKTGKSSIYVDAFNLALETVLEDERHLFDEKETEIFRHWSELEYEAQYL